jgi:N-acetylglutamate synthase-like GNAT family acetyltransferase
MIPLPWTFCVGTFDSLKDGDSHVLPAFAELSMNFRRAKKSDVSVIAAFDWFADAELKKLEGSIADGRCFVVASSGKLVGCGTLSYNFFDRGFVDLLYVTTTDRRKGLGAGLLCCIESACATPIIFTSTNLSNLPMQGLLSKSGYQLSGVVEGLDEGDPELFYRKRLRLPKK